MCHIYVVLLLYEVGMYYQKVKNMSFHSLINRFLTKFVMEWISELMLLEKKKEKITRKTQWHQNGISYEGGQKCVRSLLKECELEDSSAVCSPGITSEKREVADNPQFMEPKPAAQYRRCAALLNYIALDRCDISFAAKEVSRTMASPVVGDEIRLKRIARYLRRKPRVIYNCH